MRQPAPGRDGRRLLGRGPKILLLATDTGLLVYWVAILLNVIPESMKFRDYSNDVVQAWNWSFLPLDLAAVLTVYAGVLLASRGAAAADWVVVTGLALTFCAGFMAISFWSFYCDFDLFWWGSNGLLMLVPSLVLASMVRRRRSAATTGSLLPAA